MVLFDFGVSSMQIDAWERGFSYSFDAPLDMRMDPTPAARARDGRQRVAGEPDRRDPPQLRRRAACPLDRAADRRAAPARHDRRAGRGGPRAACPPAARFGRGNPAKRTFQAIRIAVNDELEPLDAALPEAWEMLAPGGRLAAISFHSLEDRRVKRFLADRARGCVCPPEFPVCRCGLEPEARLVTRGGIAPSAGEIADNPRSASAHLRVAVKLDRGEDG